MTVLTVALDSINRTAAQLNSVAARVAKLPDPKDNVDLGVEMVNLMQTRNDFQASTALVRTADQLSRSLLDVLG